MAALHSVSKLLQELIALPSVNPTFLPAGDIRTGEERIVAFLADTARGAGLDVTLQHVLPGRTNVIARLRPSGKVLHRYLLAPHLDTVGEPDLDRQLRPKIRSGKVFGRGACDTKGCVAVMMSALCQFARSHPRPVNTEFVFLGLVDEEDGQSGSRHFAEHGFRVDLAVVGEPTRLEVVTAHKGDVWLKLKMRGKSAHGAVPHLGRNAILEASRVVVVLETELAAILKKRSHPLLGSPTINVGYIRGGTQPNIVPAECEIWIDRRTLPGESDSMVQEEIDSLLRSHSLFARYSAARNPCAPLETDPTLPAVRSLLAAAGRRRTKGVHFFCDASVLSAGGIPSIVFGPGDIAQAHTSEEWIAIRDLEKATQILVRWLVRVVSGDAPR
ncbi:MAG: M20 family peptidase [Pedosphaera sp.]|nr:M20 family peptidase [Pedosphaera sp.]